MIKALIVEDEQPSLNYLQLMIQNSFPDIRIVGTANDVIRARELLFSAEPEMVFLDIELPEHSGFSLLEQTGSRHFEVIFTTAFSSYAVKAFEYFALGYLVKPIDPVQLKYTVNAAIERIEQREVNGRIEMMLQMVRSQNDQHKAIPLPTGNGFEIVHSDWIVYCQSEGNYTLFHLKDKRNILVCKQLGMYEKLLPKQSFIRIHSQYIINTAFVTKYCKGSGGLVTLNSGVELPVSANRKNEFMQHFTA
jgi:two-component system, LytTR family, response regulator